MIAEYALGVKHLNYDIDFSLNMSIIIIVPRERKMHLMPTPHSSADAVFVGARTEEHKTSLASPL